MPAVIVKVVNFEEKKSGIQSTDTPQGEEKSSEWKKKYINERLPSIESMLKSSANHRNYVTTTRNCTVSALCDDGKGAKNLSP